MQLAAYADAVKDADGNIKSVSLETRGAYSNLASDKALYSAIVDALNTVDEDPDTDGVQNGYATSEYKDNPIGYVAAHYLGYLVRDNRGNLDITSAEQPYEGLLRDFVTALSSSQTFRDAAAAATVTAGDNVTEVVLGSGAPAGTNDGLIPGVYAITDITETLPSGYTASIPMLVGTRIADKQFNGVNGEKPLGVITVKNTLPTIDKKLQNDAGEWGEATDRSIGDAVNYRITGKVPGAAAYDKYTYRITDTLSKGLTLRDKASDKDRDHTGIVVTGTKNGDAEASELSEGVDYVATVTKNDDGTTTIVLDFTNTSNDDGATWNNDRIKSLVYSTEIVVSYSAILNQDAVVGTSGNPNGAKLEYSNKPGEKGTGETETDEPKVYTYQFDFTKTNVKETEQLNGAEFQMFKKGSSIPIKFVLDTSGNPNTNGQYIVAENQHVEVDGETVVDTLTSHWVLNSNGKIWVRGLDAGTYVVHETKAPNSYLQSVLVHFEVAIIAPVDDSGNIVAGKDPDGTYKVSFAKDGTWDLVDAGNQIVKNVTSVTELPLTGGAGIALFGLVALMLVGCAVVVYGRSRAVKRALLR